MSEATLDVQAGEPLQPEGDLQSVESAAPTADRERFVCVDVLRGFALLGILVMNIQSFAMVATAYMNPNALGPIEGGDYYVWLLSHVFADQKCMTLFSLLFGAGIMMMSEHQAAKSLPAAGLHYRRMIWLFVIGMIHAYALWYGDILVTYAICGSIAFLFRKLRPSFLLTLGLLALLVPSLISLAFGYSMSYWPEEQIREMELDSWQPTAEIIEEELSTYRGSWMEQMPDRAFASLMMQTFIFLIQYGWRAGGLMLIGMAFWKWNILQGKRSSVFYTTLILVGSLGIPIILLGVHRNFEANWSIEYSFFQGSQFNYWGSLFVSLAYVGCAMLACKSSSVLRCLRPLAAVGQMALTNYLMHTIICTTIFYGHGFGLYGTFNRVEQLLLVLAIWTLQLVVSPLWLKRFRFGPFEWLWRSLSYWQIQPMRRAVG